MRHPVPHRAEPRGDEAIAPLSTMPLLRHETGVKQDAEVLGDGWSAHPELSRNRVDRTVGLDKEIEHPATRGMADCPKDILLAIESHHHVANIRKQTLTRQVRSGPCLPPEFGNAATRARASAFCLCLLFLPSLWPLSCHEIT